MNLDKRQWYVGWFFLSCAILDKFRGDYGWYERHYQHGTNLCHFMRVILVWTPLVVVLHLLLYGGAIAALTLVPIYWFGVSFYAAAVGSIVLVVALIAFAIVLVVTINRTRARLRNQREKAAGSKQKKKAAPRPVREKKGPSFGEVLWKYIVATKQRICPLINFNTAESNS